GLAAVGARLVADRPDQVSPAGEPEWDLFRSRRSTPRPSAEDLHPVSDLATKARRAKRRNLAPFSATILAGVGFFARPDPIAKLCYPATKSLSARDGERRIGEGRRGFLNGVDMTEHKL